MRSPSSVSTPCRLRACALLLLAVGPGCGTLQNGRGWGQDATLAPEPLTVGEALVDAVRDPWTWAPLAGAALLTIEDLDCELSDWAVEHTPVFGSTENALDASDIGRTTLLGLSIASSLATPSGSEAGPWFTAKAKGLGVGVLGFWATDYTVAHLKGLTGRDRPNGAQRSMPSTHAALGFSAAVWTSENLDSIDMSDSWRTATRVALSTVAIATAWGRVEGDAHYPSDVLIGSALGNFFTRFAHDAFLGLSGAPHVTAYLDPGAERYVVGLHWRR